MFPIKWEQETKDLKLKYKTLEMYSKLQDIRNVFQIIFKAEKTVNLRVW